MVMMPCRDQFRTPAFIPIVAALMRAEHYWRNIVGSNKFGFMAWPGCQAAEARTMMWEQAMARNADWLLWFDDDICPPVDILQKLYEASPMGDIISGFYWRKAPPFLSTIRRYNKDGSDHWLDPWEMALPYEEIDGIGFGCVLMKRKVIDHIALETNGQPFLTKPGQTEDIYFCHAAKLRHTYKIIAVRDAVCGHAGDYVFSHEDRKRWLADEAAKKPPAAQAGPPVASTA